MSDQEINPLWQVVQVIAEMRAHASDLAVLSDEDNHNAQVAAEQIEKWADRLLAALQPSPVPDQGWRDIRDYVQHKWPCALLGDGASWAVVSKDSVCTCGLDRLLAALAAPPDSKAPICLECQQQIDAAGYCLTCSTTREWALTHQGAAPLDSKENRMEFVDIVFDGPPSHESGRFVEAEGPDGRSIRIGQWIDRGDGYWALRVPTPRAPEREK